MARIDHLPDQRLTPLAPVTTHRRRAAWIAVVALALGSAVALVAVPELTSAGAATPAPSGAVLVCASGVEQQGDVQISAASAARVDLGDTTPAPPGCELR